MSTQFKKNFDQPDNSMHPSDRITSDEVDVNGKKLYRVTGAPGWRWSIDIKPVAKTDSCQMDHLIYMLSGSMVVRMDDGDEKSYGPGDVVSIPPGHDGWGQGDEPTVWLELPH